MKMLLKCIVLLILLKSIENHLCYYLLNDLNEKYEICLSNQCQQIIDPISIEVKPFHCKTNELFLKFSTYKIYKLFLNRIGKNISNLFPSKSSNQQRLLRIYLLNIDNDDKLLEYDQLIEIGIHLDIYQLVILNLSSTSSYYPLIQYDQSSSQWSLIQINFDCKSLKRINESPCSPTVAPRTLYSLGYPRINSNISLTNQSTSLQIQQQNQFQWNLFFVIFICFSIISFSILILILLIFILKKTTKKQFESEIDICSRANSLSQQINNNTKKSIVAEAYQISRIPSPHKDSIYEHIQLRF